MRIAMLKWVALVLGVAACDGDSEESGGPGPDAGCAREVPGTFATLADFRQDPAVAGALEESSHPVEAAGEPPDITGFCEGAGQIVQTHERLQGRLGEDVLDDFCLYDQTASGRIRAASRTTGIDFSDGFVTGAEGSFTLWLDGVIEGLAEGTPPGCREHAASILTVLDVEGNTEASLLEVVIDISGCQLHLAPGWWVRSTMDVQRVASCDGPCGLADL